MIIIIIIPVHRGYYLVFCCHACAILVFAVVGVVAHACLYLSLSLPMLLQLLL
jgi:hypothetical protein